METRCIAIKSTRRFCKQLFESKTRSTNILMRDHTSSNANGNFTKTTIIKAGSTFTSPKMVQLLPVTDLRSPLSLPNRPRIVSLEFHSSPPRPLPRMPLLPRNLSKRLVDEHQVTPDDYSMNLYALPPIKAINLSIRSKVLDARTVRALGLVLSPLSLPVNADANANVELPLRPRALRPNKDENMCYTPAPSFKSRDVWMPVPPGREREESNILHSPTMPRELFVPDDF
jgi:hypothetical protein